MVGLAKCLMLSTVCVDALRELGGCDPHQVLQSKVHSPNNDTYDGVRLGQFASLFGTSGFVNKRLHPALIVECDDEAQVASAVKFARRCGYKVAVRSGGHSYTGSSSCSSKHCMQLDLSALNAKNVNGKLITVGPGLRLGDFAEYTLEHGLSVPHGGCADVRFGGHFQSSAWGFMAHSYGSGIDHVESFRMVLANGNIGVFSKNDTDSTVFRSVLGSAPGSWGIITQYTVEGVRDSDLCALCSRMMSIRILWSRENFIAAWNHATFVMKDQEDKNLRDLSLIVVAAPPTELEDNNMYISVFMLWTGIDSGNMAINGWEERYWKPFLALDHLPFPRTLNTVASLSAATAMLRSKFTNHHDRYAVQALHSDHWWGPEYTELMADELMERVKLMPDIYPSFQFLPLGQQTQWARNDGMNSLTWRDTRAYVDDWMFVKNESRYGEMVERMVSFREKTRKLWEYSDGSERSTWMSPMTTYANSTDLRNRTTAKRYFWNQSQFAELQRVKVELDPEDLFSNRGTLPRPQDMYDYVEEITSTFMSV